MARHTNLDSMIPREDFAFLESGTSQSLDTFERIQLSSIAGDSNYLLKFLRKPDFQRETVQWTPRQVATLIESFLDNELIPAVILWKSSTHVFVIDGGDRLSALLAWANDDYGDGDKSLSFFKGSIPTEQKKTANVARKEVEARVGRYSSFAAAISAKEDVPSHISKARQLAFTIRGLQVQWITGDADKAESSFFKINTQGAVLDATEELILRNRRKAPAIVARSVVRAAAGHNYWSKFPADTQVSVQAFAQSIHKALFAPEFATPIKSLDLPLGGSSSSAQALALLISLAEIADGQNRTVEVFPEDPDGQQTILLLKKLDKITQRIVGNGAGSLGLHPFVWFYTSQGRHYEPLFVATFRIIERKVRDNDSIWFKKFTMARGVIEEILIRHKTIMTLLISALGSKNRMSATQTALEFIINQSIAGATDIEIDELANILNLTSRLYKIENKPGADFSDDAKTSTFLQLAMKSALKCPICNGYIDPAKSVSYDHVVRKQDGGVGAVDNCSLTHPFCNTGVKN